MYYVVVAHSIHLELICDSLLLNVILECYQPLAVLSIWFLNCSSLISGTVPQNAKINRSEDTLSCMQIP